MIILHWYDTAYGGTPEAFKTTRYENEDQVFEFLRYEYAGYVEYGFDWFDDPDENEKPTVAQVIEFLNLEESVRSHTDHEDFKVSIEREG